MRAEAMSKSTAEREDIKTKIDSDEHNPMINSKRRVHTMVCQCMTSNGEAGEMLQTQEEDGTARAETNTDVCSAYE